MGKRISILIIFISIFMVSCKNTNNPDSEVLVGTFTWSEWKNKAGWKDYSASDYTPADKIVDSITVLAEQIQPKFILFSANWCLRDCATQMPKIIKLLNISGIEPDALTIYGVDKNKQEPSNTYIKYQLRFTPTLIVLKDGEEIGRIVETPNITWENDILNILKKYESENS